MKYAVGWKNCIRCNREFLPQMERVTRCSNCSGKYYPYKTKKEISEIRSFTRRKWGMKHYFSKENIKLRARHQDHLRKNTKMENCYLCG